MMMEETATPIEGSGEGAVGCLAVVRLLSMLRPASHQAIAAIRCLNRG